MNLMTDSPIHRLTIGQRHTLRVLFDCGWNYAEAAHRLQTSEAAVRRIIGRAVRRAKVPSSNHLAYWLGREDEAAA